MTIPKIPKQEYTAEFKDLAVRRVKDGQTPGAVAKDLGLVEQTLRNGVKARDAGKLNRARLVPDCARQRQSWPPCLALLPNSVAAAHG
jgi:transposase